MFKNLNFSIKPQSNLSTVCVECSKILIKYHSCPRPSKKEKKIFRKVTANEYICRSYNIMIYRNKILVFLKKDSFVLNITIHFALDDLSFMI